MKAIKLLGILVVAMFAFGVMAVSALAGPTWLVDKVEAPAGTKVDSTIGSLLLEDMGPKVQVTAEGEIEGTVGLGGVGEITKIKVTKSAFEKEEACKVPLTVEAVNLPYKTELVLAGEEVWDNISSDGKGREAWLIECETVIGKVNDTCFSEEDQILMTNNAAGAGVSIFFNENVEAECQGAPGAGKGLITNITEALILSTEGLELEVDAFE